ncbi:hypothetical protein CEW46_21475 [Bacillus cereus]|nr:hypothetical protein CEW46_21475 [Bacillus cereus]
MSLRSYYFFNPRVADVLAYGYNQLVKNQVKIINPGSCYDARTELAQRFYEECLHLRFSSVKWKFRETPTSDKGILLGALVVDSKDNNNDDALVVCAVQVDDQFYLMNAEAIEVEVMTKRIKEGSSNGSDD